jgi:hypothetical protein
MTGERYVGEPVGIIKSGIDHDTLDLKTIDFVYNKLPEWRDDPDRSGEQAEDHLNLQLCKFLDSRARNEFPMVRFDHEEYQKDRRRVDISASPALPMLIKAKSHTIYNPFLVLEGKRLPAPEKNREKEYVTGGRGKKSGGIQRFKLGLHGAEMSTAALIGYIQSLSLNGWYVDINNWILQLAQGKISDDCVWGTGEILKKIREDPSKGVSDFRSNHTRIGGKSGDRITLRHLWVVM